MLHEPKWRRLLRFWRGDVAADVDDELRFHFEARAEELRALGRSPAEIARTIAEEFGDVEATRAALREIDERMERRRARHQRWVRLAHDVAYAWRGLRGSPAFTVGVVLTLALFSACFAALRQLRSPSTGSSPFSAPPRDRPRLTPAWYS